MAKLTLGITRLSENLGRDDGIEEPFWRPSLIFRFKNRSANHLTSVIILLNTHVGHRLYQMMLPLVMDGSNGSQDHFCVYIKQDIM